MTHRPVGRLVAVLAAVLVSVVTLSGVPAQAADAVSYKIGVFDNYVDALQGADLAFYTSDPSTGSPAPVASGTTDSDGYYTASVEPGDYWVRAKKSGYSTLTQTVNVGVEGGSTNLFLSDAYGYLSGRIVDTDENGGNGYCFRAVVYQAGQESQPGSSAEAGGNYYSGQWYTGQLRTGSYVVQAVDRCSNRPAQWVGGSSYGTATVFTVDESATTKVPTVTLQDPSRLQGRVLDAAGKPVNDSAINLYTVDGDYVTYARTNSKGEYALRNLAAGTYKVEVPSDGDFKGQWYKGADDGDSATPVTVGAAATVTLDPIRLVAQEPEDDTFALKGTVKDKAGTGLRNVRVVLYQADANSDGDPVTVTGTQTRAGGAYSFDVQPGRYKVYVGGSGWETRESSVGEDDSYMPQWYAGEYSFRKATVVTAPRTKALAPVTVETLGSMEGKVFAPTTSDDEYQYTGVEVRSVDGNYYSTNAYYGTAWSSYGLPPGTYTVRFYGNRYSTSDRPAAQYVPEFWRNRYTPLTATQIVVKDGQHLTGLDATLNSKLLTYTAPRVSGSAVKGKRLSSTLGGWNATDQVLFRRQWLRDGKAISGATGSSYKLTSSDVGKKISVRVTADDKNDRYGDGASTSKSTAKVKKK